MKSKYSLVVVVVRLVVCILPLSKFINQSLLNSSWILNLGLEISSLTRLGNDDIFSEGRSLLRNGWSRNFRKKRYVIGNNLLKLQHFGQFQSCIHLFLALYGHGIKLKQYKENKQEERSEVLLGLDNIIEFFKHFMNILLKN